MAGSAVQASAQWQAGLLIIFGVCVVYSTIRGGFNGLILQLLIPVAAALSVLVVYYFSGPLLGLLGMNTISPGGLILARVLLGILCYYLLMLAGGFLFRRTLHYELVVSRLISGAGGALIGFVYGLVNVWLLVTLIHVLGRVAEDQVNLQASRGVTPFIATLARAKASLDLGWIGDVSRSIDPIPSSVYDAIDRWSSVLSRPDAVKQLMADPVFRSLTGNPTFQALAKDPELSDSVEKGDLLAVVTNPKIAQFFTYDEVSEVLLGNQWKGAKR